MTGFLETKTKDFVTQLWELLVSAQSQPQGVPLQLLEAKKKELLADAVRTTKTLP